MPRATWLQTNFNAGEWSPLTYGRVELPKYKNALALCLNYVPMLQGGLTRRPGTRFVAEVKNSANPARLQRYEFSVAQAYVLEFGPSYIRFYTNDGQLLSGGLPYEVAATYAAGEIFQLSFAQSADVLYIAHPNHPPAKLQRLGATSWTLTDINFLDGPYLPVNTTATTLSPSGVTGVVVVTASAATFVASDVGRVLRIKAGPVWLWGTITGFTDSTHVSWTVAPSTGAPVASATSLWRMGVWGTANGYPACVVFNQDRLVWGGPTNYPNRIDGSNTSDYENMAPSNIDGTVVDSNAISFSLNASTINAIRWMVSDEWGLLVGTAGGEWVVSPSNLQQAMTPSNINAKQTTSYGVAAVAAIRVGKSTLFIQRTGRKLREMAYEYVLNTFRAPDISLVSEHLTKSGIKQLAVTLAPQQQLWMARNDGTLVGIAYDKDQDIAGWHQHVVGGVGAAVESVAGIPSPDVTRDELWVVVKRAINGVTKRYVEVMSKYWEDGDLVQNAVFLDSSAAYNGAPTTTISGLVWLPGETVGVLADGSTHPDCVVDGTGHITLDRAASVVQVGLKYSSQAKTLRIEAGGADGPAQGKLKRIHRAVFRFFQTIGMTLPGNANGSPAIPEPFRDSSMPMDQPVGLYTGDKRWAWEGSWDLEGQIGWQQDDPLPSNVLMLSAQLETQDGG